MARVLDDGPGAEEFVGDEQRAFTMRRVVFTILHTYMHIHKQKHA